jgi:hypothetical protein
VVVHHDEAASGSRGQSGGMQVAGRRKGDDEAESRAGYAAYLNRPRIHIVAGLPGPHEGAQGNTDLGSRGPEVGRQLIWGVGENLGAVQNVPEFGDSLLG